MFKAHEAMPKNNSTHAHTYINILQFGKSRSLYFIKVEVELATTNILKTKQERETGGRGGGGDGNTFTRTKLWNLPMNSTNFSPPNA